MFGKKKSIPRATKVMPESDEVEQPRELHISPLIISSAPDSMHVQVSVDSLQSVVKEQNEKCNLTASDSSIRKQPGLNDVELKVDIRAEDITSVASSSTNPGSLRLEDGMITQHGENEQSNSSITSNEAVCEPSKAASHVERVPASCTREDPDTEAFAHGQIWFTADNCPQKGSSSHQGALEDAKQTSRGSVLPSGDESQSRELVFTNSSIDGSKSVEHLNIDEAITTIPRTMSTFSIDSYAECCRICQQHTEEALVELGCKCRGELARAHHSCIEVWFNTKGSNKCEICQHIASNVPAPASQPIQHFWVWRMNGPYGGSDGLQQRQVGVRFHPLWAALLILIGGLLFDVLISIFLGASALPVNIIIGVLVILGLGTAVRLVVECWHERSIRSALRRMEADEHLDHYHERPPLQITV